MSVGGMAQWRYIRHFGNLAIVEVRQHRGVVVYYRDLPGQGPLQHEDRGQGHDWPDLREGDHRGRRLGQRQAAAGLRCGGGSRPGARRTPLVAERLGRLSLGGGQRALPCRHDTVPDVSSAVAAAKTYAERNYGIAPAAWDTCVDGSHLVVPSGGSQCISFSPNLTKPTTVRVKVSFKTVKTPFASVLGLEELDVVSEAHATLDPGGVAQCGLCVIGTGMEHDLQNGDATVHGADIHFNGDVRVGPNGPVATDGNISVQGSAAGSYANHTPDPMTGQAPISDPLAFISLPPSMAGLTPKTDPCGMGATHGPGIYGSRNLRNMVCNLQPGVYVIAGGTWDMAGNASSRLLGTGVTLYFMCGTPASPRACNPNESGGTLDASGNGQLGIQAPASGPLTGLAILFDRENSSTLRFQETGRRTPRAPST